MRRAHITLIATLTLIGGLIATPAHAQLRRRYWGVSAEFVPTIAVPNYQKRLLRADRVDLPSTELKVGFVRGPLFRSHWGLSFLSRTYRNGGSLTRGNATFGANRVRAVGVEACKFVPFTTIKERVQLGTTVGFGVGWLLGSFTQQEPNSPDKTVGPRQFFRIAGASLPVLPTFVWDFTVAAVLREEIRVFIGAGLDVPGEQHFRIGVIYLFGVRQ